MTRDEVRDLLTFIKTKKPNCFSAEQSAEVLETWSVALEPYSRAEVDQLFEDGGFIRIPYYNYKEKDLQCLVQGLEEQRFENSDKGKAFVDALVKDWNTRHPPRQKKEEPKPLFDCENCKDDAKDFCGGGICMKMLGGKPCRDNGRI